MYESPRSQTKGDEPRAQRDLSTARIVERIVGRQLASEVEEYFERGARVLPGDVVVDVGANIGAFAAAVAARTGGDVTLHCFEPRGPIFTSLERNFAEHALLRETRHELHAVALSSPLQHGTARPFYYFRRFPTDSTYDIEHKLHGFRVFFRRVADEITQNTADAGWVGRGMGFVAAKTLTRLCRDDSRLGVWLTWRVTGMRELRCDLVALDRVLAERGITRVDLLKIDVEGAELDVLRGCGAAWPGIRRVALETDRRGGRADEVLALLASEGFRITSCEPPRAAASGDADLVLIFAERP